MTALLNSLNAIERAWTREASLECANVDASPAVITHERINLGSEDDTQRANIFFQLRDAFGQGIEFGLRDDLNSRGRSWTRRHV